METTCPRCHAAIRPDDRFCPSCGHGLEGLAPSVETEAKTAATRATPDHVAGVKAQVPRRKHWYRQWRVMVPLVLVGMIGITLGAGAWYIKSRFDTLNELTTPPAEISGGRLGGDDEVTIDTGPAQEAVREAEARREAARNEAPPTESSADVAQATTVATAPAPTSAGSMTDSSEVSPEMAQRSEATSASAPNPIISTARSTELVAVDAHDSVATTAEASSASEGDARGTGTETAHASTTDTPSTAEPNGGEGVETAVIAVNAEGSPVLVSEPVGTPAVAAPEPVKRDSYAFLMMGVDARPGEAIDVGVRPDSLFVVYLDGSSGSCRVLSIPRDTRTTLPGYGQSKINHALAVGGVPYERLVVENLLGIELEHYGLIDFSGVEQLVDAVGGITIHNDYAFSAGGHDYPVGTLELDGDEALAYARFRGGPDGDFGRQVRQQRVVRALLTEGADMDVVTAIPNLLGAVSDHVRTDLGPNQMVDIAQAFRSTCNGDTLTTNQIEGTVAWAYDDLMQMDLSFVLVDPAEVDRKVQWLLTGQEAPTQSGPVAPSATPTLGLSAADRRR